MKIGKKIIWKANSFLIQKRLVHVAQEKIKKMEWSPLLNT